MDRGWTFEEALLRPALENGERPHGPTKAHQVYEAFGESKRLKDWAADPRCTVAKETLAERIERGWTMEDALTLSLNDPTRRPRLRSIQVTAWGETKKVVEWVKDPRCQASKPVVLTRLMRDWPSEDALSVALGVRRAA